MGRTPLPTSCSATPSGAAASMPIRSVVGTTVELNKHPFTVIGVAPRKLPRNRAFLWPDFWMPIVNEQQIEGFEFLTTRCNHTLWILGLVKPGVTQQQATDNLNIVAGQLAKQYPAEDDGLSARLVKPGLMGDVFGDPTRTFLFGILLLSFLVLLAACANLASIFAARAADRSRELAIRLAIGSSRWHILRQLLTEAVLVSLAGGIARNFVRDRAAPAAHALAAHSRSFPFT